MKLRTDVPKIGKNFGGRIRTLQNPNLSNRSDFTHSAHELTSIFCSSFDQVLLFILNSAKAALSLIAPSTSSEFEPELSLAMAGLLGRLWLPAKIPLGPGEGCYNTAHAVDSWGKHPPNNKRGNVRPCWNNV